MTIFQNTFRCSAFIKTYFLIKGNTLMTEILENTEQQNKKNK